MVNSGNQPGEASNTDGEILEQIVDEFTARLRAGEHPAIAEYQRQHPALQDELEDLLGSVAMIEQLKTNPISPQHAHRPSLEIVSSLEEIDCYKVIRELGRGGMGVVLEAVHESLGRRVAIKVMPTPLVNGKQYIERFKDESKAAARLHHTNIVGVFGVGEGDGFHYYVMDLVDGKTLGEVIAGLKQANSNAAVRSSAETRFDHSVPPFPNNSEILDEIPNSNPTHLGSDGGQTAANQPPVPPARITAKHCRWAARIGANLAAALAYAHDSKILHRDIKPSNVILDRKGVAWITDFGLAKDSSSERNLTKTGDVIGTPQYLAPESLEGKYDQRSEVYCLGLTLYELATLQPAYPSGTTAEVIRAIATSSPVPPRKLNAKIPTDLSTIIEKAVARDPQLRYQTAEEFQQDLLAFVEDRPIAARPPSTFKTFAKWSRRNPLAASLSALSGLLLLLVAVSASIGYLYTIDAYTQEANKSAKLRAQIKETQVQKQAADLARKEAEQSEENMKAQFNRAEANVEITIAAFDEMFKQVVARGSTASAELDIDGFEELQGIETSVTKQDAEFLDKFLSFYDQFATQNADNASLQLESARAFRRVGNIYQLLGEFQRSIESYQESIEIYEQVVDQSPESKNELISLVQTKNELSRAYRRIQDWNRAIIENESAIQLLEELPVEQLDNELKLELAKALNSIGSGSAVITLMNSSPLNGRPRASGTQPQPRGRTPDWMLAFLDPAGRGQRGFRNGERVPPQNRTGEGRRRPAAGPGRGADVRRTLNRGSGGRRGTDPGGGRRLGQRINDYARTAIKILDELVEEEPENAEFRSARANGYCSLASTLMKPNPQLGREMRDLAIAELESLIQQDSENSSYQYRLALALSLADDSDPSNDQRQRLEKSVEIASELTAQFPKVLDYHYLHGLVCNKLAGRLTKEGDLNAALETLRMAHRSFVKVTQQSPTDRARKRAQTLLAIQLGVLIQAAEKSDNRVVSRRAQEMLTQIRRAQSGRPSRRNSAKK